ncbi:MAG: FtsH protease activity modulator HflK [Chromatiales bacterium]|nr:FtsH protease activity modulator HflK [Gammaproteobacteria bacterium]MCP5230783.1 FtsH protease activity modulator HflK [Zoogloeaceae bacterium]MCP5351919.1 FtsH protease activity modulator HflK [Chromatiales bacterium]
MAWNEPGGGNNDPWGGGGRGGDQGPPDLDEVLKKLQDKLGGLFGGNGGQRGGGSSGGNGATPIRGGKSGGAGFGLLLGIALILWVASGIYIIEPAQRGVVLRFGQYAETTAEGPHWHIPYPIETVEKVDVDQVRSVSHKTAMLTQDENIVEIDMAVQYRVKSASDYLFQTRSPDATLKQATESAVREVIGQSKMDFVLTEGRTEIVARTEQLIQELVDRYQTGLDITSVNLQDAQPPEPVQAAFNDAVKAREDEQRLKNEAEAYASEIIPKARGEADRRLKSAEAYKAEVIANAEGEAARFESLLTEYAKAPKVTRERLYLETIEQVLGSTSKIMIDTDGGNSLMYLPIDKLIQRSAVDDSNEDTANTPATGPRSLIPPQIDNRGVRPNVRQREIR